jgi:hypothetical protein
VATGKGKLARLEHFQAKWTPGSRQENAIKQSLETFSNSMGAENVSRQLPDRAAPGLERNVQ